MSKQKEEDIEAEFTHETQRTGVIGWIEREYNKERGLLTKYNQT